MPATSPTSIFEHAYFIGNYLSAILIGVELVLYFQTISALIRTRRRNRTFTICFSTMLLVLLLIDKATVSIWGEQMWITYRDEPDGVLGYLVAHSADWYFSMGTVAAAIILLSGDAFIIYRTFMIWGGSYYIVAFPILMWFGTCAMAILQIITSAAPQGNFFGGRAIQFGTPYYTLSIAVNVLSTCLIVGRIFSSTRDMEKAMGKEHVKLYTGVIAILVESAAPYALIGFMTIIPYGMGKDVSIAFGQVYITYGVIAPQMIMLRVAQGAAWDRDTLHNIQTATRTSVQFGHSTVQEPDSSTYFSQGPHSVDSEDEEKNNLPPV